MTYNPYGPPPPIIYKTKNTPVIVEPVTVQELVMTSKAGDITAQQYKDFDSSWTDDLLIELGYAYWKIDDN